MGQELNCSLLAWLQFDKPDKVKYTMDSYSNNFQAQKKKEVNKPDAKG